jgi:hypothetical protein
MTPKTRKNGNKRGNSTITAQRIVRLMERIQYEKRQKASEVVQHTHFNDLRKAS